MAVFRMISRIKSCIFTFEEICSVSLGLRFPNRGPLGMAMVSAWGNAPSLTSPLPELDQGFLWAVPRNRRTIERRWKRKYGSPEYSMKIYLPKTNLIVCNTCGHNHEIGYFCGHCYAKIAEETKAAQDAVQEKLGLSAVDKEVVLLYDGEQASPEQANRRVVEVKRPRPSWFSRNLLQRSTDTPSPTAVSADPQPTPVKPSELG
ncbi:hypothetical protein B566_EDAN007334 [Ephemera danica]|nr:hypothetical protein B566_EDAN007334 [Ephemera danica]